MKCSTEKHSNALCSSSFVGISEDYFLGRLGKVPLYIVAVTLPFRLTQTFLCSREFHVSSPLLTSDALVSSIAMRAYSHDDANHPVRRPVPSRRQNHFFERSSETTTHFDVATHISLLFLLNSQNVGANFIRKEKYNLKLPFTLRMFNQGTG